MAIQEAARKLTEQIVTEPNQLDVLNYRRATVLFLAQTPTQAQAKEYLKKEYGIGPDRITMALVRHQAFENLKKKVWGLKGSNIHYSGM